jgi:site-specific DNA-methyltransferase (adenine-specific)
VTAELWHGDSRELAEQLPAGINCVIADPPYGVDFQSRRAVTPEGKKFVKDIAGDGDVAEALSLFDEVMWEVLPKCAEQAELYVFTRWDIVGDWIAAVRCAHDAIAKNGFKFKMLLVWDKGIPGMGDLDANWGCGHELILYLKKGRRDVPFRRSGIIHVDKLGSKQHIHPTEKPVRLLEHLIEMSTDPGDLVVDPFAGSGSSIVAAQNLGRRGIGIERDADYIARARPRLEQGVLL